jgi:hypothetical protein
MHIFITMESYFLASLVILVNPSLLEINVTTILTTQNETASLNN